MPQVTIEINGRTYTMQCGEGQEQHLRRLARMVDTEVANIRDKAGQLGEIRLLIMTALVMADRLVELDEAMQRLQAQLEEARRASGSTEAEAVSQLLRALEEATGRLENMNMKAKALLSQPG